MALLNIFWSIAFTLIGLNECSLCNYLYEINTTRAYPTDVCMQLGTNSFIKYQCTETLSYPSNYTITLQSFSSSECETGEIIQEFDLNEWILYQNTVYNISIQILYKCGGLNNCFIKYNDICNNNNRYYPLNQCLNNYNKSISFKYECNPYLRTFSYWEYNEVDCIASNYSMQNSLFNITPSTNINTSDICMQYNDCKSTPYPTLSPSYPTIFPTKAPNAPTLTPTNLPTYHIPFWNKSLEDIISILKNRTTDKSDNACRKRNLSFALFICHITFALLCFFLLN